MDQKVRVAAGTQLDYFKKKSNIFSPVSTNYNATSTSQCTYLSSILTLLKAWQGCDTTTSLIGLMVLLLQGIDTSIARDKF